jgi:hypothetical protein
VWNVMRKNAHVRRGLALAGFTGGWLDRTEDPPSIEQELIPVQTP